MFGLATLVGVASVAFTACTVTPTRLRDSTASFDGNQQNSGFLGFTPDGAGVLTPKARARYNGLIEVYGGTNYFRPPLKMDSGLTPFTNGTFQIDAEHLVKFGQMNRWRKSQPRNP